MNPATKRFLGVVLGAAFALSVLSGCDKVKSAGNSTGNKVKQGGDAGGSTGYP